MLYHDVLQIIIGYLNVKEQLKIISLCKMFNALDILKQKKYEKMEILDVQNNSHVSDMNHLKN